MQLNEWFRTSAGRTGSARNAARVIPRMTGHANYMSRTFATEDKQLSVDLQWL
jgi:hypothetical protein